MPRMVDFALRREPLILRTLFFLAPLITLLSPRTTVPALILLSIGCLAIALAHGQRLKDLFRLDLGLGLFAALTAYLLINATWSLDPARAVGKGVWFGLIVLMAFATCRAFANWENEQLRVAARAFLVGLAIGVAIVLFECATDRLLTRALYNALPFTQPKSAKALVVDHGQVLKIAAFDLNKNTTVMLLMLWPALMCLWQLRKGWRLGAIAGLCVAVAASILLSRHEASKAGLVLSVIVFLFALPWPVFTRRAIWAAWCLAFVLVVPLATVAYQAKLHEAEWLQFSAKARVILWAYTAEQIPKAPILGIGIGSARRIDLEPETRLRAIVPKGSVYAWRASPHAHNVFLQTWYELGVVGVILFTMAGSWVIFAVARLPLWTQRFALAHFAAFMATAAVAWGMWQSWFMAVAGLAALYAALAVNIYRDAEPVPFRGGGEATPST